MEKIKPPKIEIIKPVISKKHKTKHHRLGSKVIKKAAELNPELEKSRKEEIKRQQIIPVDESSKVVTMSPIIDDIFNLEDEKFKAEKLAFKALNLDLSKPKPNPKYVQMVAAPQFKKAKVVLNLKVEDMSIDELLQFMNKAQTSKGEV